MKNKRTTPMRIVRTALFTVIALLLLSSMLLTSMLGSVRAEYFKSLTQGLNLNFIPDLCFEYYLNDANGAKTGSYKNAKNVRQSFTTSADPSTDVYQIKIPVTEEGYYVLSFYVDFFYDSANRNKKTDTESAYAYVRNLDTPIGCQVVKNSQISFGADKAIALSPANTSSNGYTYGIRRTYDSDQLYDARGHYQWKTVAPTRGENVELSFYADSNDVSVGYMVWCWELTGLAVSHTYIINLNNVGISKTRPIDEDEPYFEFMNVQYLNNGICPLPGNALYTTSGVKSGEDPSRIRGVKTSGYTRYNQARGTYVTNGTYDSLTMQIQPLYAGWNEKNEEFYTGGIEYSGATASNYENLEVINVPMKNIKPGVSYRVAFDFSVAMQGNAIMPIGSNGYPTQTIPVGAAEYADYGKVYNSGADNNFFFTNDNPGDTLHFQSYLHSGAVSGRMIKNHTDGRVQITCLNKSFPAHEVTRYDEIMKFSGGETLSSCDYTTVSVTDDLTHAAAMNLGRTDAVASETLGGNGINWLNAIKHTNSNGENEINWLTFYNTAFTINVDPKDADIKLDSNGYLTDFYWTWSIDALEQTNWYRVKIENFRIEEVVQYGSYVNENSLSIDGEKRTDFFPNKQNTVNANGEEVECTNRSTNGTGQNYQARGYLSTDKDEVPTLAGINIYGAIYDAGDLQIDGENYNVTITGYCAVKGGVEKYVWSADGGKTWHDTTGKMVAPSTDGEVNRFSNWCESYVDQGYNGNIDNSKTHINDTKSGGYSTNVKNGNYDHVDFLKGVDNVNGIFSNITADLSEYRMQGNIDVIFAAVPRVNTNLRCEILRIINYNPMPNYRTYTLQIESDITVSAKGSSTLSAVYNAAGGTTKSTESPRFYDANYENKTKFRGMSGVYATIGRGYTNSGGYSRVADGYTPYEDMRAIYSDFPVKSKLTIRGWAIVEGGTENYYWTADYGESWNLCGGSTGSTKAGETGVTHDTAPQRRDWYDGIATRPEADSSGSFGDKIYFDDIANGQHVTADLREYIGQTVDVIFAAKSNAGGPYCPVARIDNVGVFGDPDAREGQYQGKGPFYVRTSYLSLGSAVLMSNDKDTSNYKTRHIDDTYLNGASNYIPEMGIHECAYTSHEPYNVDIHAARLFNDKQNGVSAGATITIGGFLMCNGGIANYKFTLDGGENWSYIDENIPDAGSDIVTALQKGIDASFNVTDDVAKSDYRTTKLKLTLPEGVTGVKRLLVVAESTKGYEYPVLHIVLNIE